MQETSLQSYQNTQNATQIQQFSVEVDVVVSIFQLK